MEKIDEIIGVDHIGYAVNDMTSAKRYFEALGYSFGDEKADELRKVNVCVGKSGGVKVEILAPLDGTKSPIDGILKKMGSTPYHICYNVKSMESVLEKMQNMGYTLMGYPTPSEPLGGEVCFLYSAEIGIVELIEYMHF